MAITKRYFGKGKWEWRMGFKLFQMSMLWYANQSYETIQEKKIANAQVLQAAKLRCILAPKKGSP
jgi:hypothetical protein